MSDNQTPESAVRRYLGWLDDPRSVVDEAAVARADAAFAAASDPIDRLHAAAARERARAADVDRIIADFVANARAYADAEGIPVEAFRALGVDDEVLARAGFAVPLTGRGRNKSGRTSARPATARSPQVSVATIKSTAAGGPKRFTLAQLAERAGGGSPATIKKAVDELIVEGLAVNIGADPTHQGPGRAPN
ncbi:MAG: hypothetical protein KDB02_03380, partial [Acidimicrobiales bacterium]|nr:hypothetical protein [Acidimicrobiales bacterium]